MIGKLAGIRVQKLKISVCAVGRKADNQELARGDKEGKHPSWFTPAQWAERGPRTADRQGLAPAWVALAPVKPLWARPGNEQCRTDAFGCLSGRRQGCGLHANSRVAGQGQRLGPTTTRKNKRKTLEKLLKNQIKKCKVALLRYGPGSVLLTLLGPRPTRMTRNGPGDC